MQNLSQMSICTSHYGTLRAGRNEVQWGNNQTVGHPLLGGPLETKEKFDWFVIRAALNADAASYK